MTSRVRGIIAIAYAAVCVMLGGASAEGAIGNALLQILAIGLILSLLWTRRLVLPQEARLAALVAALFVGLCLLSLIPLPWGMWSSLPFRTELAAGMELLGVAGSALPLTLAPAATLASLLWLLPPAALFLMTLTLPSRERRRLAGAIGLLALLSLLLGIGQLFGSPAGPLYLYEITSNGRPVGFFANINHQVTLIVCALPLVAAIAPRPASGSVLSEGPIMAVTFALFMIAGVLISGSLAGYGLLLLAGFSAVLIYRRAITGKAGRRWKAALGVLVALFAGFALVGPLSQQSLSPASSEDPYTRRVLASTTMEAIGDSFPLGTGLGTFADVYRRYENPAQVSREFANHAHNDFLEIVLELGVGGLLLIGVFVTWWLRRSIQVWRSDAAGMRLAAAGSVVVGIILLHSLVDYPLRTAAIAAVFAVGCALLIPPPRENRAGRAGRSRERLKHLEAIA